MRVIGVSTFGGPDQLQAFDVPQPEPGSGEVRVSVYAAAVNPTDTLLRAGEFTVEGTAPHVPGMDAAGVIDKLGPDADGRLAVGDQVVALVVPTGPRGGAYADKIVVPAASVVPLPAGVDFPAAATLLMNAVTARLCLDTLDLGPGKSLGVTGAAGAVGGYAIQLAKADGLHVVADSSLSDKDLVRSLGADQIVARGSRFAGEVRAVIPKGVDGLIDAALLGQPVLPVLADNAPIAAVRRWDGPAERGIQIHQVRVVESATNTAMLAALSRQASNGILTLRVAKVIPAEEANEAHRQLEAGGLRGRLVLDFSR
jgi:NADPH2:quinone reductase